MKDYRGSRMQILGNQLIDCSPYINMFIGQSVYYSYPN